MTTTTVHHRQFFLPALTMFIAIAAIVIAVFALATDPADVTEVITQSPSAAVTENPAKSPAALAPRTELNTADMTPLLTGCSVGFSRC